MSLPPAGSGVFYFNKVWLKRVTDLSLPSLKTKVFIGLGQRSLGVVGPFV
jgi:hypothetical protein